MAVVFNPKTSRAQLLNSPAKSIVALTMLHASQLADTLQIAAYYLAPPNKGCRVVMKSGLFKFCVIHVLVLHVGDISVNVRDDGWFNLCKLTLRNVEQVCSLIQPQSPIRLGQVRLIKPAIIHKKNNLD